MKKLLSVLILSFCIPVLLFAQKTIKGKVVDENGKPAVGVNVEAKGTGKIAPTNQNGEFTLVLPKTPTGEITLVFSSTEFTAKTIKTDGNSFVNAQVQTSVTTESDVVVVGYQTLSRKDLTAPVSSVGSKQLKDVPINNAAEALQGRLAGVTAMAAEGSPDADVTIRVRGGGSISQDNAPLYIIDGVQVESGLNSLSVQDIQSIDVLKDASATAIYGARGANGVIIVTTKGGKGGKVKVTYNGFVGVKKLANKLDVLDPQEFLEFQWERASLLGDEELGKFGDKYVSTWDSIPLFVRDSIKPADWQEEVMGRNAFTTTQNIGVSGGSKKLTYNVTYTYNNEEGIVFTSDYKRHIGNVKLEYKPTKKLKIGLSGRYNDQVVNGVSTSDDGGASLNRLRNVIKYKPFLQGNETIDYNDPDLWQETSGNGLGLINPVALMRAEQRKKHQVTTNGNISAQYNFSKTLSFKTTVGYDYTKIRQNQFSDSITSDAVINGAAHPILELDSSTRKVFNNSNVLTWNVKNYKRVHDFTVIAGQEIYNQDFELNQHRRRDLPLFTTSKQAVNDQSLGNEDVGRGFPKRRVYHNKLLSFFGKVNYAYKDKYLLSATVRADGSSKFAPESRWGWFPSGSFAWRVSKENFMKDVSWISDMKFRVGYGEAGNNRIDDYLYFTTFAQFNPYGLNDVSNQSLAPAALSNYYLKWETNVSRNLGLDVSFLNGRIDLVVDVYKNSAENLLLQAPVSTVLGYSSKLKNIGGTVNKGVEIQINATAIKKKDFTWTINFNNSWNKNEIKQLTPGIDSILTNSGWSPSGYNDFAAIVGKPVGSMVGFVYDGFYTTNDFHMGTVAGQSAYVLNNGVVKNKIYTYVSGVAAGTDSANLMPGALKLKDLDGDGVITAADRTIIGNPNPKFTGGLNQQFTYKNFDMSFFINWAVGGDVMNANKVEFTNSYTPWASGIEDLSLNNRWRVINDQGQVVTGLDDLAELNKDAKSFLPLSSKAGNNAFLLHSWAIEDASFLRINNLTVGYTIPKKSLKRYKIQNFRLYVTANNIAVLTGYSGYDPEVSSRAKSGTFPTPNVDYSAYPRSRSFIFGVNVGF